MADKIEVSINVIVYATENISKILNSFEEFLGVKKDSFSINETTGHFENPIITLEAKLEKENAKNFINKILSSLSNEQIQNLIEEIDERTVNSRFHVRLDKQEMIKQNISINEKGMIKLKIHSPIYNKKDTVATFTKIFLYN